MKKPTLTEVIDILDEWIVDTMSDLRKDWNEEKELTAIHLQHLLVAMSNLEAIKKSPKTHEASINL